MQSKEFEKVVWLLDPRFDFLLPWFSAYYHIPQEDILFVGSYHGATQRGYNAKAVGNIPQGHVVFLEPEDINRRFAADAPFCQKTLVIPFTGAYLQSSEKLFSPVATGQIAIDANNKWWQYRFFQELNIPTPKTWRVNDTTQLADQVKTLLGTYNKLLIKKAEMSGGYQMCSITSLAELSSYCISLTPEHGELLISEYIPHEQSFAGMGIVGKDGQVHWCGATEQVLYQDYAYEGLIWPPYLSDESLREIENLTREIGKALARNGYFGYYNVDYILSSGKLYAVEVNARFGFSTLLFALSCGEDFWHIVTEGSDHLCKAPNRLILGKIKGHGGQEYTRLSSQSDIVQWFQNGYGEFRTMFCGTESPEVFDYGSFIGLFGAFLPANVDHEDVLRLFWSRCLQEYIER